MEKRPYRVVFCLPGTNFSGKFLDSWTSLLTYCIKEGIQFSVSRKESSVVYYVRSMCLGGDVMRGVNQKPFNGKVDYTHLMWIDSDMVYTPEQFQRLLDHDVDIASGIYKMSGGVQYAAVKDWNVDYFKSHGTFQFLTDADVAHKNELIDVSYNGFGFMLIKKGVFESMQYPWFQPVWHEFADGVRDFSSEDASFCLIARKNGYKIWADPQVRPGHFKSCIY